MQAANNLYVIIAREVSTDAADKMNSIIKIIDKFTFNVNRDELAKNEITLGAQQIGLPANYSVATSWIFDEKLKKETFFNFRINIYDPTGKKLDNGPEQENLLPAGIDRINMNFNVQGLPVTTEGTYKLRAELVSKDKKLLAKADYPFTVEFIEDKISQPKFAS
jgi:hypothetical protein